MGAPGATGPVGGAVLGQSIINGNAPGTVITAQHPGDTFIIVILGNDFAPTHIDLGVVPPSGTLVYIAASESSDGNTMTLTTGAGQTGTSFPIGGTLPPFSAQQYAIAIFNGSVWNVFLGG
jgi:hypothetical protein